MSIASIMIFVLFIALLILTPIAIQFINHILDLAFMPPKEDWRKQNKSTSPNCKSDHLNPPYLCEQSNDPCYFYPKGQDNTMFFKPRMKSYLKKIPDKSGCDEETKLLVTIKIRPCEFEARQFIRHNWGDLYRMKSTTQLIFVMGMDEDHEINLKVDEEIKIYDDILRLAIQEHYRNNSLKAYGVLNYAKRHCPYVKCIVNLDSDVTVNIRGFERLCDSTNGSDHKIHGKLIRHGRVNRQPEEKWYRPYYVYPNDTYPSYVSGAVYMMSGYKIAHKLLNALWKSGWYNSENRRRMCDDVMFTGIIREAAGIKVVNNQGMGCSFCRLNNPIEYVKEFRWCEPISGALTPLGFENRGILTDREKAWNAMRTVIGLQDSCYVESLKKLLVFYWMLM